ncbi:MAG: alanine racemase [Lachnospiraceae bacterium]|nr:alanine racemase [Lachnospiraceae bacterium]
MNHYERVCAYIDLNAVLHNMEQMHNRIKDDCGIMCVIKTDAYGHGAVQIGRELEKLSYVKGMAVATPEEAMILRHCGIQKPILILGYVFPYAYEEMIKADVRISVFRDDMLDEIDTCAEKLGKKAKVHIKVDTAMNRIGIKADAKGMAFVKRCLEKEHIETEGIFTHFAKADEADKTNVLLQLKLYREFLERITKETGHIFDVCHCSNSAGIIELSDANMDMVRAGIILYGLWPSDEVNQNVLNLQPVLSLKSHIVYVKDIEAGSCISYGGTFRADRDMKIATIPIGYGDGYPRGLSNKGTVLIAGKRAPILGRVCMDQFMVDVSHIPEAKEGMEVTLIGTDGNESITMEELGSISGRFNYELACDLGKRIPRAFIKDGEIVATKDYYDDYR